MVDKFNKELFTSLEDEDLTFTQEDRKETFKKIKRRNDKKKISKFSIVYLSKQYIGPVLGTVMVFLLAIGLFLPNLFSGNDTSMSNPDLKQAIQQKDYSFSALVMGKDSTSHRSNINILLTYNGSEKSIKLVPIPRDTYVEIFNSEEKMIGKDKLMHAIALNRQPEQVLITVSNLFNISVDYYSVIAEEDIYRDLGIRVDGKDESILVNEVGNSLEERSSFSKIKKLLKESETNIPIDILNEMQGSDSDSIQVIDMNKGLKEKVINGIYYVEINQKLLEKTSTTLKQHLGDK
ncbi:LCP family protein [Mesobacillus subterraneus]|uniref:LCP family glycopolymer transferase n=1 Tax=Mesobacillus subterraneus TaxID=285983 RepID=UPI001CFC7F1C|nr:LCP family protein [Mesobacillus subterraneus]WLR54818.1 LCP family protein [Mesobacillus subterraneus]